MQFDSSQPIYIQIVDQIKRELLIGTLKAGDKIAPVRELALSYEVNPNTMQKALAELEREGYLYSERTAGRYVTKEATQIAKLREELPQTLTRQFVADMQALQLTPDEILKHLQHYLKEKP